MRCALGLVALVLGVGCSSDDASSSNGAGAAAGSSGAGASGGAGGSSASGGAAGSGGVAGAAGSGTECEPEHVSGEPYPRSCVISELTLDWSTHDRRAAGADNWPVTWGEDDDQYTAWGDGWGFEDISGTKISLGVSRLQGDSVESFAGIDVWQGDPQGSDLPDDGKSYGILAIGSELYMWVSPGSGAKGYQQQRLWRSTNGGQSWTKADFWFVESDGLVNPTFLQFGAGYAGALDSYVYIYANEIRDSSALTVQKPGAIALLRVDRDELMTESAYEAFAGLDASGDPIWVSDLAQHKPVFEDAEGVGWNTSASYNAGLARYFLITEHTTSSKGNLGVFEAPAPWGPWSTVRYESGVASPPDVPATAFFWNFSNKWLSADGRDFVLVFTGIDDNDSWNTVRGSFVTP